MSAEVVIVASHRVTDCLGGVEKFATLLSSWCSAHGLRIKVVFRRLSIFPVQTINGPIPQRMCHKTVVVKSVELPFQLYYLGLSFFSLATFITLLKLVKASRIDESTFILFHSQDINFAAIPTVLVGKLLGVPSILHQHGPYIKLLPSKNMQIIERAINIFVCKFADKIIVTDKYSKDYLIEIIADDKKINLIPAAVDVSDFKDIKSSDRDCFSENFIIGYIGRLSPEKNVETLLIAFAEFVSTNSSKYRLLIVGDGPSRTALEQLVIRLKIGKFVEFTGFQTDIKPSLAKIDVFVLPSTIEGTPISLLEAMASGKVIVASDIPAIREIVDNGIHAILFDAHNTKQLAAILTKLYFDYKLRDKLSKNARERVMQYELDFVYQKIFELYKVTISEGYWNLSLPPMELKPDYH